MLEVLVVRHGESTADIEERFEGRWDCELTELGIAQAELVAKWIKANYPPDVIISSPLKRAARTAEIIGAAVGLEPLYDDALLEWDNGKLAGRPKSEGDEFPETKDGPVLHWGPYGTESGIDLRARAQKFWVKLVLDYDKEGPDRRVCLVSHGMMIGMLFRSFLDLPICSDIGIKTGDTGVHLWRIEGKHRRILFSNSQAHLLGKPLKLNPLVCDPSD